MKHIKKIIISLFCVLVLALCCPACAADTPEAYQERLAKAEQKLAAGREELATQLRAYYLGEAGEAETARLIKKVEEQRLLVETLRAESSAI